MASSSVGRYYDSATGQFLSVDPDVAVTGQPYVYVGNDPVNGVDPLGLSWWNPVSDVVNAAKAVAAGATWAYHNPAKAFTYAGLTLAGAALVATTGGIGLAAIAGAAEAAGDSVVVTSFIAAAGESAGAGGAYLGFAATTTGLGAAAFDCQHRIVSTACIGDFAAVAGGLVTSGGGLLLARSTKGFEWAAAAVLSELGLDFSGASLLAHEPLQGISSGGLRCE